MKKLLLALVFVPICLIAGNTGFIPLSEIKLKNSLYIENFFKLNKDTDFGILPEKKLIGLIDELIFLTQGTVERSSNGIFDLNDEIEKLEEAKSNLYSITSTVDLCTVSSKLNSFAEKSDDPNKFKISIISIQFLNHAEKISKFHDGIMFKFVNS